MLSEPVSVYLPIAWVRENGALGCLFLSFLQHPFAVDLVVQQRGCLWCSGGELIEPVVAGLDTVRGKARAPTSPWYRQHLTQHASCVPVGEQDGSVAA